MAKSSTEELIQDVVERIKEDLNANDTTAIEALLSHCPTMNLILFLPEDKQKKYGRKK